MPAADTTSDAGSTLTTPARRAALAIVARTPASLAAVIALLLAMVLFLLFHPAADRHDDRLATMGVVDDLARFR